MVRSKAPSPRCELLVPLHIRTRLGGPAVGIVIMFAGCRATLTITHPWRRASLWLAPGAAAVAPSPTLSSSHRAHRRSRCNGSAIRSTAQPTTPANNINHSDAVTAVASGPSPSLPAVMYRPYAPRNARDRVARRQRSGLALRSLQSRPYLSHHSMPDVDPLEVLDDPCGAHRPLRHVTSSW